MALSTFDDLWRQVRLRCPAASLFLAREWVDYSFRRFWDYKLWSWQRKRAQFLMNPSGLINTGTATVTFGSTTVQGTGTAWQGGMVSSQFRIGLQTPIYTIMEVDQVNQVLTLDAPWGAPSQTNTPYQSYMAYVYAPQDFQNFITIWDPNYNWQLETNVTQEELNAWDAQRANQGTAYVVASYQYDSNFNTPPVPMFEIWPHQRNQYVYPYLYVSRPPDLSDPGAALPRYIRGDVLLQGALASAARWPGAASDKRNPYFNLALAAEHDGIFETGMRELARTDEEIMANDVTYLSLSAMPFASIPYGDARYLQSHDL